MAYIEIQVKDKKDFAIISRYSDYSSIRTGVCSLSALGVKSLNGNHPDVLQGHLDREDEETLEKGIPDPIVVVEDDKIYVRNGDIEILSFLDTRSLENPEVKIVNLWKLFDLIRSGILKTDESFNQRMQPLDEESLLTDLFASTGKMRFRNKLWSLADLEDYKIKDLKFGDCDVIEKNFMTLKDLTVQQFFPGNKTVSLIKEGSPSPYTAKFYYMTPNMLTLLSKNRKVTLASEKAYGSTKDDSYSLVNPLILPRGHKMKKTSNLKCSRVYPSAIYNAAYAEYLYRKEDKE